MGEQQTPRWHKAPEVLDAARHWRDRCFQVDGSILSDKRLWTLENLEHLQRHFVENLDYGEGDFLGKLERQLAPTPAEAKQLAAEFLWLLYLCVSEKAAKGGTKRLQIKQVWEWSGAPIPEASFELGAAMDVGVASPGTAYNTQRWRELIFAIELTRAWKQLPAETRESLIGSPWDFARWLDAVPTSAGRQFRHMLLYLLFPDHFERVVSGQHKAVIAQSFLARLGADPQQVDYKDRTAVDIALYELRPKLRERYDAEPLDYYLEPLQSEWSKGKKSSTDGEQASSSAETDEWFHQTFGNSRVWVMGAGEGARLWPEFQREEIVAIGLGQLPDLSTFASKDQVLAALVDAGKGSNPTNDALAGWQFVREIQVGDHVLVKKGRSAILAHGVVTSEYRYDDTRSEYRNVRDVEWRKVGQWPLTKEQWITTKTLTDFTPAPYRKWLRTVWDLMQDGQEVQDSAQVHIDAQRPGSESESYSAEDAPEDLFLTPEQFSTVLDTLARKKNVILEGAPGVGKTFVARRIAWALLGRQDVTTQPCS